MEGLESCALHLGFGKAWVAVMQEHLEVGRADTDTGCPHGEGEDSLQLGSMAWDKLRQGPLASGSQWALDAGDRESLYCGQGTCGCLGSLAPAFAVAPGDLTGMCW